MGGGRGRHRDENESSRVTKNLKKKERGKRKDYYSERGGKKVAK